MRTFDSYLRDLQIALLATLEPNYSSGTTSLITESLNGGPYKAVRKHFDNKRIRSHGIYFSSQELSRKLIESSGVLNKELFTVFDPACGAGDLIIGCARRFPIHSSLSLTLEDWGNRLFGYDIIAEFVVLTKIRLTLLAFSMGAKPDDAIHEIDSFFPNIKSADFLNSGTTCPNTDLVVLNPPFSCKQVDIECDWSSGKVNQAALFVEKVIRSCADGTKICAILPDVLRSGTRYKKWREWISRNSTVEKTDLLGIFDNYADVDVYSLTLNKQPNLERYENFAITHKLPGSNERICDFFDIRVGTVVPHRDPEEGEEHIYLTAREVSKIHTPGFTYPLKKSNKKTFTPPFVVVKRTSSPTDKPRARAIMIFGENPIAIENHLIVFTPKDSSYETCERLVAYFNNKNVDELINERIRCRHLTISSLGDLPWPTQKSANT